MSMLREIFRELASLFVDDGALALGVLATVAVAGALRALMPDAPLLAGAVLLLGCIGMLLVSVMRAARR